MAKECYDNYNKRIGTGILNDVISKAILMKEPPVVALKRLKDLLCYSSSYKTTKVCILC